MADWDSSALPAVSPEDRRVTSALDWRDLFPPCFVWPTPSLLAPRALASKISWLLTGTIQ